MVFKNVSVNLDGEKNGIIVEQVVNGKKRVIADKSGGNNRARLFKNLDVAKVNARYLLSNEDKVNYYFKINKDRYNISEAQKAGDIYQIYDMEKEVKFIITEDKSAKVLELGYYITENGDTVRCDKQYGIKRVKKLLEFARDIASGILFENGKCAISSIRRESYEYVISVKNSTVKIHILTNSKLMDINQARKADGIRCLPYLKEMDKFTTLFVYTTKDPAETSKSNAENIAKTLVEEYILEDFNYYYFNNEDDIKVRFTEVEFNGYISVTEA